MPSKIDQKVVFDSKWVQVVEITIEGEDGRQTPYLMTRHPWSNSTGVAILCYRNVETEGGFSRREYLGRYEYCPAHGEEMDLCSITGGFDKPETETPIMTAIRELEEEGGFAAIPYRVIDLGTVRNSKSSDNIMHLFAVNVEHCIPVEATGDGTVAEQGSYVKWVQEEKAIWSQDVLLPTMIQRLKAYKGAK